MTTRSDIFKGVYGCKTTPCNQSGLIRRYITHGGFMTLEHIEQKAETFFEFPTANKDHVTTTSAVLFARECANCARAEGIAWAEKATATKCLEILNVMDWATSTYEDTFYQAVAAIKKEFGLGI